MTDVEQLREPTTGLEPLSDTIGNLEFDREEKARLVALMLAIQYHTKTLITDADYLRVMLKNERYLEPSTADKVVAQAERFYGFLKGPGAGPAAEGGVTDG